MKAEWLRLSARYDALQWRERWLIAVAVLGGIFLMAFSGFIEPAVKGAQLAERSMQAQRAQMAVLQAQQHALQSPEQNPDALARAELVRLKAQLGALAGRFAEMEHSLVPPQRMAALLEDMIGRRTGLRLLSLKTLPAAPLLDRKAASDESRAGKPVDNVADASSGLFKHGVEIRLEGSYQELAAYLERLEQSKMKLLWSSVSVSAANHPKLVLTLSVYTLSMDRTWLIV